MRANRLERPWDMEAHSPSTLSQVNDAHSGRDQERTPTAQELIERLVKEGDLSVLLGILTGDTPEGTPFILPGSGARNTIRDLLKLIPDLIDLAGDILIPRYFPEFGSTEELMAHIFEEFQESGRLETAQEGAVGMPGVNMFFGNGFPGGHTPNCQYFAIVRPLGGRPNLDIPDHLKADWENATQGPIYATDRIIPCWGPIVGVDNQYLFTDQGGQPVFDVQLRCNGLGLYPRNGRWAGGTRRAWCWPNALEGFEFFQRLRLERRGAFSIDGPLAGDSRPHQDLWSWGPGGIPDHSGAGGVRGIGDAWLYTGGPAILAGVITGYSIRPYFYSDGRRALYGQRCFVPPEPPPPGPAPGGGGGDGRPIRGEEEDDMSCCNCEQIARLIDHRLRPIYQILGFPQSQNPKTTIEPEQFLESLGLRIYANGRQNKIEVSSIQDAIGAVLAAHYMRSGLHRLPAQVPESLADEDSKDIEIVDAMSWQEWMVRQLDGLIGAYPMKLDVRGAGDDDPTRQVQIDSTADALREILGLLMGMADSLDTAAQCSLRAMLEASKAGNAALIAQDYAKANAEYMGYRGEQVERIVKASFSPSPDVEIVEASAGSGPRQRRPKKKDELLEPGAGVVVGWQWQGQESLQATLNQLLLGIGIIKAALVQPLDGVVVGDDIRKQARQRKEEEQREWSEFLDELKTPPPNQRIPNAPDVDVRDISRGSGGGS